MFDENVNDLFQVNASYLYRLLRAHQKLLQFVSLDDRSYMKASNTYNQRYNTIAPYAAVKDKINQYGQSEEKELAMTKSIVIPRRIHSFSQDIKQEQGMVK